MQAACAIVAGVICALAGCAPMACLLEKALRGGAGARPGIGEGLAAVIASFVMLSLALLVCYLVAEQLTLTFGCAMMVTFLLVWAVESLRALKDAGGTKGAEGKDE